MRYHHTTVNGHLLAIDADGNVGYAGRGRGSWDFRLGKIVKSTTRFGTTWDGYVDVDAPRTPDGEVEVIMARSTREEVLRLMLTAHGYDQPFGSHIDRAKAVT